MRVNGAARAERQSRVALGTLLFASVGKRLLVSFGL